MARGGFLLIFRVRTPPKKIQPAQEEIALPSSGRIVPLRYKPVRSAKRLKLKVKSSGVVEITLPQHMPLKTARSFVSSEINWLETVFEKIDVTVPFADGSVIPVQGESYRICHRPGARTPVWIEDGMLNVSGGEEHLARRVTDWLKKSARLHICERAEYYADKANVSYKRISVRDQQSRWGSCSAAGNLNFSWRLYLMPTHALDYVVAHEVAHLRHMNHGPEFWALVAKICPHMKTSRQWMSKNAGTFHKYNATS